MPKTSAPENSAAPRANGRQRVRCRALPLSRLPLFLFGCVVHLSLGHPSVSPPPPVPEGGSRSLPPVSVCIFQFFVFAAWSIFGVPHPVFTSPLVDRFVASAHHPPSCVSAAFLLFVTLGPAARCRPARSTRFLVGRGRVLPCPLSPTPSPTSSSLTSPRTTLTSTLSKVTKAPRDRTFLARHGLG